MTASFQDCKKAHDIGINVVPRVINAVADAGLGGEVAEMAKEYNVSAEEMALKLKDRYDGYHFNSKMLDIYNPFSLLSALKNRELKDYWFRTGTPTYLIRLLAHNHENLNDLTGHYYRPADFVDYKADIENPLAKAILEGKFAAKDSIRVSCDPATGGIMRFSKG